MQCCYVGKQPSQDCQGLPWTGKDAARHAAGGTPLGFVAALCQVRGDWQFYCQVFNTPHWGSHRICWKCRANHSDVPFADFSASALWRQQRVAPEAFLAELRAQHIAPNPLLSSPCFSMSMIMVDVLHTLDLGVTQDVLGSLFVEVLPLLPGTTQPQRVQSLWRRLLGHYEAHKSPSRVGSLTWEMIKRDKKPPKLKLKGAETRHVVPFGVLLAAEFAAAPHDSEHNKARHQCLVHLWQLYDAMSTRPFAPAVAAAESRSFLVLLQALREEAESNGQLLWPLRPKCHLVQEMAEFQAVDLHLSPTAFWAYADEDFVGFIAKSSAPTGGPQTSTSLAKRALQRYRALAG
jgi:hypothetical protein